ncbi:MAG: NfeD family protein [Candidatus Dormibacteraeota bacterium]|nr:NfeD family protein [Candidatus Dormibacteraeota bacterium]
MLLLWIVVALVFAIVEVATVALYAGFLAVGAVVAAVVAAFLPSQELIQVGGFVVASGLGVVAVRPVVMRRLRRPVAAETLSGAQTMLGNLATIVKRVEGGEHRGHARIFGENWPAMSADGKPIEVGTEVRIVELRGATLVVEPARAPALPGAQPGSDQPGPE